MTTTAFPATLLVKEWVMIKSFVVDPVQVASYPPIVTEQVVDSTSMSSGIVSTNCPLGVAEKW